jgi:hypothetical protein
MIKPKVAALSPTQYFAGCRVRTVLSARVCEYIGLYFIFYHINTVNSQLFQLVAGTGSTGNSVEKNFWDLFSVCLFTAHVTLSVAQNM